MAERKWSFPRPLSVSLLLLFFSLATTALIIGIGPLVTEQVQTLVRKNPDLFRTPLAMFGSMGYVADQVEALFESFKADTRLDSRQAENALLSTIAFAGNDRGHGGLVKNRWEQDDGAFSRQSRCVESPFQLYALKRRSTNLPGAGAETTTGERSSDSPPPAEDPPTQNPPLTILSSGS